MASSSNPTDNPSTEADTSATPDDFDAELADFESSGADHSERGERVPLPPATFATLVTMLSTQSLVGLGLIPHPATGKPTPNAELAKHFIDLLGVVDQKCRGNLDPAEQRGLDAALHDLRMAYVQFIRRTG